jgi:hypothetical protein
MVLRETQFFVGGLLTIGLGLALAYGLVWAGAGFDYFGAWIAVGGAIGFGAFFLYVARDEHRNRLAFLAAEVPGGSKPPPTTPPGR